MIYKQQERCLNLLTKINVAGLIFCLCFVGVSNVYGDNYHVTTTGESGGDGSVSNPWDLMTALKHPASVQPGDTIFVHGGTYNGNYSSSLTGSIGNEIVVMNYNNEKVILDGNTGTNNTSALAIYGAYTIFKNLEVLNSDNQRLSSEDSKMPTDIVRCDGVNIYGDNIKLINFVVHDNLGIGMGMWSSAENAEVYGCILYHNGWIGPNKGEGHNMYAQNLTGSIKTIAECVIFNAGDQGTNIYTEDGSINSFRFDGNVYFNNGSLNRLGCTRNLMIGGYVSASDIIIRNTHFHHSPPSSGFDAYGANLRLGFAIDNNDFELSNSHISGGTIPFQHVFNVDEIHINNNTFVGYFGYTHNITSVTLPGDLTQSTWDNNDYYYGLVDDVQFPTWQSDTGLDPNGTYTHSIPKFNEVFVRPNTYEPGRGHVIIYNWESLDSVDVDLASLLNNGDVYSIYDVENLSGLPVVQGTYTGSDISVPMNLSTVNQPTGNMGVTIPHTEKEFGCYIVVSDIYTRNLSE
jgi:hypothetical protein